MSPGRGEDAMTAELVRLALRTVMAATPSWTLWLGLISFMAITGTLLFFYEQVRRRTYIAVLEAIQPDTLLLDRTRCKRGMAVIRLRQPWPTGHDNTLGPEDLRR